MRHERRKDIIEKILKLKTLKVRNLMDDYQVSVETIREDLAFLEKMGYLRRVYGGAVLHELYSPNEVELRQREQLNSGEKLAIGKTAAALINDGDSVFIGYGTTTIEVARHLAGKNNLTILTNAVLVAQELAQISLNSGNWKIILLGGELRKDELTVYGGITVNTLKNFNIAKALIGVSGIDLKAGLTDYNYDEASVHRLAIEQANTVIALADHDKFGIVTLNRICPVNDLDILVTDWQVPDSVLDEYRSLGIKVYVSPMES
ncbi:MAG: DeoR/GlpR family DNA-binding transcription regulator [Treponema sp.]|nr:DeoR/GlpR family DNA-binding transcription regulator [Treponema sp.]